MIVDPHVPVSQQSGHAHTSYPPLSAAVAQVGRLEISRVDENFSLLNYLDFLKVYGSPKSLFCFSFEVVFGGYLAYI